MLSAVVAGILTLSQATPLDDPRLQAKLSLQQSHADLPDLVAAVARQTGVRLEVARALTHRKVAVFAKERPAVELMRGLASVFRAEWKADDGVVRLTESGEAARDEQAMREAERQAAQAAAKAEMQAWMRLSQSTMDELKQRADELRRQWVRTPAAERPPIQRELDMTQRVAGSDSLHRIGTLLRRFSDADWSRLWAGEPVFASTRPGQAFLPFTHSPRASIQFSSDDPLKTHTTYLYMRFDQGSGVVDFREAAFFESTNGSKSASASGSSTGNGSDEFESVLYKQPLRKWLGAWTNVNHADVMQSLDRPLRTVPKPTSPYYGGILSPSEMLAWLSQAAEMPILAEATRQRYEADRDVNGTTVGKWLTRFLSARGGYGRVDDGWLLVRPASFWNLRDTEIPERLIVPLEAQAATIPLTVDHYAAFATQLSPGQGRSLRTQFGYALRFDPNPCYEALPALQFWGAINPANRAAIGKGNVWPAAQMPPALRTRFWNTALNGLEYGLAADEGLIRAIAGEREPDTEARFAFWFVPLNERYSLGRSPRPYRTGESMQSESVKATEFFFGAKGTASAAFRTGFPQTKFTP